jgi:hypothetical protein
MKLEGELQKNQLAPSRRLQRRQPSGPLARRD